MRIALALLAALTSFASNAQVISGTIITPTVRGAWLVLLSTRGSSNVPVDSARIDPAGDFRIPAPATLGAGFYQLALHDTDRVDIILDPKEREVVLAFEGIPLQWNVRVIKSPENDRLWRYKRVSREAQAVQDAVLRERGRSDPLDRRQMARLDSVEQKVYREKNDQLARLMAEDPASYFAFVVRSSNALDSVSGKGPDPIAKVFDFSDPRLLRSSVYDKAVLMFLQSINVVSEEQLTNASDTLIHLASRDNDCKSYMVEHLIDLFTTYGPQSSLQHIVDRYLAGEHPAVPMTPSLRAKVNAMLAVSIGAIGPDVDLVDSSGVRTRLSAFAAKGRYTLLFVYSSTCDHCHHQMPGVNDLFLRYNGRGFRVAGVALDADRKEFRSNIEERGLRFPCFSEFNGWGSAVAGAYQVKATPTLILLDHALRIISKPQDAEALGKELERIFR